MLTGKPDFSKFSFSTFWNASRQMSGEAILKEIMQLGFSRIELNYYLDEAKLAGLRQAIRKSGVTVTSVQSYCPYPAEHDPVAEGPDCFSLASIDEQERRKAVDAVLETIRVAKDFGAPYVVVHSGRVEIQDMTAVLFDLLKQGKGESTEYEKERDGMIEERGDFAREHLDAVCESYAEITREAKKENIILGIKNRLFHREIPNLEEALVLLKYFRKENLGYWHDTGFAYVQEGLGFYHFGAFIEKLHHALVGTHLHDILHLQHHAVPCLGEYDFFTFESFLQENVVKVIEVSSNNTPDAIISGLSQLDKILK